MLWDPKFAQIAQNRLKYALKSILDHFRPFWKKKILRRVFFFVKSIKGGGAHVCAVQNCAILRLFEGSTTYMFFMPELYYMFF